MDRGEGGGGGSVVMLLYSTGGVGEVGGAAQ
jgi:hypothetical protein